MTAIYYRQRQYLLSREKSFKLSDYYGYDFFYTV